MPLDFQRARPLLQSGNLTKLFVEELGWEPARQKLTLRVVETDYALTAIAEKRGFTAWSCACANGKLPDHTTRLKLDRALTQTSFEHLIVFPTHDGATQSWMWVRREQGKPLAARTHEFNRSQPGDSLLQKLQHLYISLEDEERGDVHTLTLSDGARAAFDIEKVTKAFYRDFDTHRKAFLKFIEGIGEVADREWYASVMLNRLMFVYFIQRKGFLDGDTNYLRNRLDRCKKEQGKDKFYTFYRYFLLRLFHEGFGKRRKDRAPDLEKLLGNIPYLNGGLFDVHELEQPERYGKEIQIDDKAFERVFNYFDQYQWHLDERPLHDDNEINPDVLGYIFEKYINQKQMGAYYTKEDITEYISKNTVIPFLFDAAKAKCKVAFENADGPTVWDLLRETPDRYIYSAVRHGVDKKLPAEIAAGIKEVAKRSGWNKAAAAECALPTETWREVVARRQRYEEVRKKLAAGEVRQVNDFITLNLDLRQFAQDVIQNCEGPDLLMAFWQAITSINTRCADVEQAFNKFRQLQTEGDGSVPYADKQELQKRLKALEEELNRHLASEYGVKVSDKDAYNKWLKSHQPFHWFVQFYGILSRGGFDVIIGNPPYVEYKDVKAEYQIRGYKTETCSNLFVYVLERCTQLSRQGSEIGMIIPLSAFSTDRMIPLITHLKSTSTKLSIANFSWRPGKLFDGVNLQLSILLQRVGQETGDINTTRYLMWDSEARTDLFSKIEYVKTRDSRLAGSIPKLGATEAASILQKLRSHKKEIATCFAKTSNNKVYYRRGGLYWKVFVDFVTGSSEEKIIDILPEIDKYAIIAALSSDLWWWYFTITSDCRHLGNRDIGTFPFDPRELSPTAQKKLSDLGKQYVKDLKKNAVDAVRVYKGKNSVECISFRVNQSKEIIDEIDTLLAGHFGFTPEELDFIINYDIKYRLGRDTENEDS
jgi:methylase of polypeptide subunit release factors